MSHIQGVKQKPSYNHCSYVREPGCDHAARRTDHHSPTPCIRTLPRPSTSPVGPDTPAEAPEEDYTVVETARGPFRSASYWQTGWSGADTARVRVREQPRELEQAQAAAQAQREEESLLGWAQEELGRLRSVAAPGGTKTRFLQAAGPESTTSAVN